jgi:hypothetical protein
LYFVIEYQLGPFGTTNSRVADSWQLELATNATLGVVLPTRRFP